MDIAAVEDIQSLCPLELEDEGEGLPAYEESVTSGLSSFGAEDREGDVSPRSDKYSSQGEVSFFPVQLMRMDG
jgi:hypothetical protein